MNVKIIPSNISGEIIAPASKSYAHRYVIASYLSGENCVVKSVGASNDIFATLNALSPVGLNYKLIGQDVELGKKPITKSPVINCEESGSTIRFLIPVMSALGIKCEFTGSKRLLERPMGEIISTLNANGGDIIGFKLNGKLTAGEYIIAGNVSSQFITGLLFALPLLSGDSYITVKGELVSKDYINITLDVLSKFSIIIEKTQKGYFVKGNQKYVCPKEMLVEGDFSGSAFPLCMGAIGGRVSVTNLNPISEQGDRKIINALKQFGANVIQLENGFTVSKAELRGTTIDCEDIPDIVQVLAVVASYASGVTTFKNVTRLEIKESNRVQGIINNLELAGIKAEYNGGNLTVYGGSPKGGIFQGENDHRTVMSACVMALFAEGESEIIGAEAVKKSYPSFFNDVLNLGGRVVG